MPKRNSLKSSALGVLNQAQMLCIPCAVTEDASSGIAFALPFAMKIVDVIGRSTATVASATATVSDGTDDITDAIDIDTIDVNSHASTIDTTYASVNSVTVTTAGASDRAVIYIMGYRA